MRSSWHFFGCFACNLGDVSVFETEVTSLIFAIESDSTSAVLDIKNAYMIRYRLRNRWHNCFQLGITVVCSHIYREDNCFADLLASHGHGLVGSVWFDSLPSDLSLDFFKDRISLPNYRFP